MGRKINLHSISGGKDSTAMILLSLERETPRSRYVFADTGNEHEDVYEYLVYLEEKLDISIERVKADFAKKIEGKREYIKKHWANDGVPDDRIQLALDTLHPTGNAFLDMCIWKGCFPATVMRFCTDELKTIPITQQVVHPILKSGMGVRSWQGIRWDESPRRKKMVRHEQMAEGVWTYRPILEWTADDVFAIHRKHGIKPNPLYLKGMNRVGCMPCIMCRKGELAEISRRFPDVIDKLRRWENIIAGTSKFGNATFFQAKKYSDTSNGITTETHGIDEAVKWARTERGGKQFNLFTEFEEIPSCSSNYGLCELEGK